MSCSTTYRLRVLFAGQEMGYQSLDELPLVIGSASACALQLLGPEIEAEHLRISGRPPSFLVEPVQTNACFRVNGAEVYLAHIEAGDRLEVGSYALVVEKEEEARGDDLPAAELLDEIAGAPADGMRLSSSDREVDTEPTMATEAVAQVAVLAAVQALADDVVGLLGTECIGSPPAQDGRPQEQPSEVDTEPTMATQAAAEHEPGARDELLSSVQECVSTDFEPTPTVVTPAPKSALAAAVSGAEEEDELLSRMLESVEKDFDPTPTVVAPPPEGSWPAADDDPAILQGSAADIPINAFSSREAVQEQLAPIGDRPTELHLLQDVYADAAPAPSRPPEPISGAAPGLLHGVGPAGAPAAGPSEAQPSGGPSAAEPPFLRARDRWHLPGCTALSGMVHVGFIVLAMGLGPGEPLDRIKDWEAVASNRFVRLIIEKPKEAKEGRGASGKGKKGGRKRRGGRGGRRGARREGLQDSGEKDKAAGGRRGRGMAVLGFESSGDDTLSSLFASARSSGAAAISLNGAAAGGPSRGLGPSGYGLLATRFGPGGQGRGSGRGLGDGRGDGLGGLVGKGGSGRGRGRGRVGRALMKADRLSVRGNLSPSEIKRVIRSHHGSLRRCYINRLQTRPGLQGRITVHFTIDRRGKVRQVSSFDGVGDAALKQCVENRFRGMRFPKPAGGEVKVNYPLTFQVPS